MPTFRSILCPVDFSTHSALALRYAAAFAGAGGATLTVVWVQDRVLAHAAAVYALDPNGDGARAELLAFVTDALPAGTSRSSMELVVTVGDADRDILKIARIRRADLIVMGTHGLSGYQKMFFGSTTERVLRHTSIPVLAVPLREESTPASVQGRVLRGRVVVAVDLGQQSQMLIDAGREIAKRLQAPMVIVHVVEARSVPARWRPAVAAQQLTAVAEARQALGRLDLDCPEGSVEPIVVTGRPADHIAAFAEARDAAVIVMGLISGRGSMGARPDAIAYRVLTLAPAPVLVIPASGLAPSPESPRSPDATPLIEERQSGPQCN